MKNGKFLIVGGYGKVGRTIATLLSQEFPQRVVVAGRNFDKANQLAVDLDYKVLPLALDISSVRFSESILDDVSVVIMCIDQQATKFVESCLRRGIDYIDITAGYEFLSKLEALNDAAIRGGSTIVSSVGLAPGLTNVLASLAKSKDQKVSHIDLFIMLGLGDKHGEAAERWTIENLSTTFQIRDSTGFRQVRSFHEGKTTRFPEGLGVRRAYRFNFPDQHVIPNTLNIDSASTWFCLDSSLMTEFLAFVEKLGISKVLRYKTIQNALIRVLQALSFGSDLFVIKAEAYTHSEKESPIYECSLTGHAEGYTTGMVAAKVASLICKSSLSPGVFHMEQIVDPVAFVKAVEKEGLRFYESTSQEKKQ